MSKGNKKDKTGKSEYLYKSKNLGVYSDVNLAAEAESFYSFNQTPLERIRETVQLILRVFPLSEKQPNTNKIYIDKE